jgi:hypothetical protein
MGYLKLYPGDAWKSRLGYGSRPGLVLPWDLEACDGPFVVCGDPADAARVLELGGCAVGLPEPAAPLDELVAFLGGDDRNIVVAPGLGRWADEVAYRLGERIGRPVQVLNLPDGARGLRDCVNPNNTPSERR